MVFVAVGEHDAAHVLAVLDEIGDVGDDDIDAEQFGFGEHEAGVDDDNVVAPANGHAVHAEFAEAAEGNDLQFSGGIEKNDASTRCNGHRFALVCESVTLAGFACWKTGLSAWGAPSLPN